MNQDLYGICPYTTAQKVISGKWAVVVLYKLKGRTLRFGELQRELPDLTQATLTKQLRSLEGYGLIKRKVYPEVPPRVEYSLSRLGEEFVPVLDAVEVFGTTFIEHLKQEAD